MTVITEYIKIEEVRIAYQVKGEQSDNCPLVMVMGLSGVKEDWGDLVSQLAESRQVLVIDNRGMGESDIPTGAYSIEVMARDVLAVANQLDWEQFDLLGVSMGGMISQQLAVLFPQRIRKLVLMSTSHGGPNQTPISVEAFQAFQSDPKASVFDKVKQFLKINYTQQWLDDHPKQFEANVHESIKYRRSGRGILNQMSAIMGFNLEKEITKIKLPTLVVHGSGDRLLDFSNGRMIAEKIPDAKLETIEGAGHLVWMVDRGASADAVNQFLSS